MLHITDISYIGVTVKSLTTWTPGSFIIIYVSILKIL